MIKDYIKKIKSGKINIVNYVKKAIASSKKINKEFNYFNTISEKEAVEQAKRIQEKIKNKKAGKLAGVLISVKDNICVKGIESTAGSKILSNYKPLFDATVVDRLKKEDAVILGKASCDAFGFGGFNLNVGLGLKVPKNPFDKTRATGGSSGGSAGITQKANFVHVSLGTSTGGSIENPASFCGVIGFCPTYGFVSRNGLISYANSFDKIGVMGKEVEDIKAVIDVIGGYDPKDSTSLKNKKISDKLGKKIKVGIIKEAVGKGIEKDIKKTFDNFVKKLKKSGAVVEEVSLPLTFKYGIATYYILVTSEASTNLACLCGLRYGAYSDPKNQEFNKYFSEVRSANFNEESKRRIMLGTFTRMSGYRDAYYIKATKVRTKIIQEYKALFQNYDFLISPTMPILAPKISKIEKMDPLQLYLMDTLTVGPNLAGIPHASYPIGKVGKLPVGAMIMGNHREDYKVINFLERIEGLK